MEAANGAYEEWDLDRELAAIKARDKARSTPPPC